MSDLSDNPLTFSSGVRRALFIKLRHIGDVLLATPTFRALKAAYPEVHLAVLVREGTEEMLTHNPDVDELFVLKKGASLYQEWRMVADLRSRHFDLAVNMTEGDHGVLLAWLSGARHRIGLDPLGRGLLGKRLLLTHGVHRSPSDTRHKALQDLDLLAPLGVGGLESPHLEFHYLPSHAESVAELLMQEGVAPGTPYVVIHPTSRWQFKCWRDEAVAELVEILEQRGYRVIMTAAPDASELTRVQRILGLCKTKPVLLAGKLGLKQLGALIAKAHLFVGVDSAPMHMAAALGTPVVALFGPSDYRVWGPLSPKARIIVKTDMFPCIPCQQDGCGGSKRSECLEAIQVDEVVQAAEQLLARTKSLENSDRVH
jgi:heptosyltransferase-3